MRSKRLVLVILMLGGLWIGPVAARQKPLQAGGSPASLADYGVVTRGRLSPSRGLPPAEVVRMDTNGEILMACLEPKTIEQLRSSGIQFVRSQLELLADWEFLKFDRANRTYTTTIHVYGPEKASAIRALVSTPAVRVAGAVDADLKALRAYLEKIGRQKALFSVLYAYVLHGYSMDQFSEEIYRKPELSAEHPFWNGYAWAIFPVREFDVNPTQLPAGNGRFFVLGGELVSGPSFRQWLSFLKDAGVDLRIDDPDLRKDLAAFELADGEGKLTIPVFDGAWPSRLEAMAASVYAETKSLAASTEMRQLLGMETQAQAEMFVHYEMRHAMLTRLLKTGVVTAPLDFDGRTKSRPADAGNLAFLISAGDRR